MGMNISEADSQRTTTTETNGTGLEVAVIGTAVRFPGVKNIHEFWNNLKNGIESIAFFSDRELEEAKIEPQLIKDAHYVKAKGFLEGVQYFDASFFDYTPMEADLMNPQIRLFHECTWEALENAGYDPSTYDGLISLFAGTTPNLAWQARNAFKITGVSEQMTASNLNSNFFTTLISYKLDLKGAAVTVQTACSTSLVAIHMGCRALLTGECDMALAGGVTAALPPKRGYLFQEGMIFSSEGHCRTFDARANGTISGEGCGIVVLKLLADARDDNDHIYAVIKGSAINNDGKQKGGYTAPGVEGQAAVIKAAFQAAEIVPETITYVETHGTATALGDTIEIEALKLAFNTDKKGYCGIGSVKTNIGHLDSAAGVAGFIKAVLALKHKQIPPNLHFETPNPKIDLENSPFYVVTQLTRWENDKYPLRAGVSSFGIGGTNVHVVLEESPGFRGQMTDDRRQTTDDREQSQGRGGVSPPSQPWDYQLILLSARTLSALDKITQNLVEYFKNSLLNPGNHENPTNPGLSLADAAYTLQVGRKAFEYRRMLLCSSTREAVELLESTGSENMASDFTKMDNKPVVFMFPGQGSQYVNMGLELYQTQPLFRAEMDRCFEILKPLTGYDIKEILYPLNRSNRSYKSHINQTEIAQPVIFALEYALAKLLMAWGIVPHAMIGHSIGEYTAACLSGVFSLEDALKAVFIRGKLMQTMPPGDMLSVALSGEELLPLVEAFAPDLSLAAINSPSNCVVSGPHEVVNAFARQMKENKTDTRYLHTSHAFHSNMMTPVLKKFKQEIKGLTLEKPQIPFISNVTGQWITSAEAVNPGYWARQLRETVQFADGLTELVKEPHQVFLETGPGRTLTAFLNQHPQKNPDQPVIHLIRHPKENRSDTLHLLSKIGLMWLKGVSIDWESFHGEEKKHRRRIPLPAYSFERQSYPVDIDLSKIKAGFLPGQLQPGKRPGIRDWFYTPLWHQTPPINAHPEPASPPRYHLLFLDRQGVGDHLLKRLEQDNQPAIVVKTGLQFKPGNDNVYFINPRQAGDYDNLFTRLRQLDSIPRRIFHLWNITGKPAEHMSLETLDNMQYLGFYSLMNILRAMAKAHINEEMEISVVTDNLQEVVGHDARSPEKATLLGALNVIPLEYPNITCRGIDILLDLRQGSRDRGLPDRLYQELVTPSTDNIIAYRGSQRWVQKIQPAPLDKAKNLHARLKKKGVYLLTGGLGGIGMTLADHLARTLGARIVLVGRSPFPPRDQWNQWVKEHHEQNPLSRKIRKLQQWQQMGAEIMIFSADTANLEQMRQVITRVKKHFGTINGVIHAAGVADYAGVIQRRTPENLVPILAPKLKGTLVLDILLKDLDFFVLCSSLSSVSGAFGQVGYCAANAFLDNFACYKNTPTGPLTISINWDTWQEKGMAVEAVKRMALSQTISHPLFHHHIIESPNQHRFISYFSVNSHWLLGEHRVIGTAALPGTAYLEMARVAFEHHTGKRKCKVEISDVTFLMPLSIQDDEEVEVHTLLETREKICKFSIRSRSLSGEAQWLEHANGKIAIVTQPGKKAPKKYSIKTIEAKCSRHQQEPAPELREWGIQVGPRWDNLRQIKYSTHEALGLVELPGKFKADLPIYQLHPALLDTATSFLVAHYAGKYTYLPFSYKRVCISGPLPLKAYAYARYKNRDGKPGKSPGSTMTFDITIMDETGVELVEIEAYTLVKLSREKSPLTHTRGSGIGQGLLENGIEPAEGIEVFLRILSGQLHNVVVSTTDFYLLKDQVRKFLEASQPVLTPTPRPGLKSTYAAPFTKTQQILAGIWQEFLGVDRIGIHDDFFELGGDSLKAVSLRARIHKKFNAEVPVAEFFNSPTISDLGKYIDAAVKSMFDPIEPVEKKEYYELSSAQKRLFFIQQVSPTNISYNLPHVLNLVGRLDRERFERAFQDLIRRHESLRTSFVMMGKAPMQIIHQELNFKLKYRQGRKDELKKTVESFVKPFNLGKAPLLRTRIICLSEKENHYIWLFDIHHIIADATAIAVLQKDLFKLYNGEKLSLFKIQYKDFSSWQNHLLEKRKIEKQKEYWLNLFSGEIPALDFPLDYPPPGVRKYSGDSYNFRLGKKATRQFKELAFDAGATLFINLLAVLNILLFKYTRQRDIIVGTSIAGRPHADLQKVLGMFANMMPVRNLLEEEMTYLEFLKKVKTTTLEAFENQDMQFEMLVEQLNLPRDFSRNPLFNICLVVQNYEQPTFDIKGLKILPYQYVNKASKFDITLWANEIEEEIYFILEYSTELFKPSSIENFSQHFLEVLTRVIENKNIQIKDIRISHQLLYPQKKIPRIDFGF